MNALIRSIISQVPTWRNAQSVQIVPQKGGLTNANYLITVDGARYVLRIGGDNGAILGIDRNTERAAWAAAASIGVAPEVILYVLPKGHLITRYIDGKEWTVDEFRQPETICRVAHTMKRVHALLAIDGIFSPYRDVEKRLEIARARRIALPEQLERCLSKLYEIEAMREAEMAGQVAFCHNDPFPNNFLDDGTVRLLDWEFAGMGDVFYDLASVAHFFTHEQKAYLLECYFGEVRPAALQTLEQMWFVVAFWNATWALLQIGNPHDDHDYATLAQHIFAGMAGRL